VTNALICDAHSLQLRHPLLWVKAMDAKVVDYGPCCRGTPASLLDTKLADKRQTPGGQPTYFDMAISVCLTMGIVFRQPLRQTQGLVGSWARLMGMDVPVPDFSTLSRRGAGLSMPEKSKAQRAGQ
jgi:hypothetical protein